MTLTAKQTRMAGSATASAARSKRGSTPRRGPNAFPKSARLLKHASFQHAYENGRKHFSASMIFFFILTPVAEGGASSVRVGITVGRVLGGAVVRNRIKRRMRDVVRHKLATLQSALGECGISAEIVINPKKTVLMADIAALRAEVERGFGVIAAAATQPRAAVQSLSQKTEEARNK